jgi:hypothetical protein
MNVSGNPAFEFKIDVPGALKNADKFLRGKLWIDAKTFQIRREEQELTVQAQEPVIVLSSIFEYQSSDYGLLVPKRIFVTFYDLKNKKATVNTLQLKIRALISITRSSGKQTLKFKFWMTPKSKTNFF